MDKASVSLNETKSHLKISIDGTMDGIDEFFADTGDVADVTAVVGSMFIFMMAATNDCGYYYDYNYHWDGNYYHSYHDNYDPWK